jgi:predicted acyltransferase
MKTVQVNRALGLDALRGFAILAMFLSGLLPFYNNTLPSWMYHAQLPPPLHEFTPTLPGLTWVDLVFPMFLFAMGAAFPLALSKRIVSGNSKFKIVLQIIGRGLLLAGFAIYIQHIKPYALNPSPGIYEWLIALLGFAILFPVLFRLPKNVNPKFKIGIRVFGLLSIIILLSFLKYPDGSGFSLGRSDIIILVLANTALFGSLVWLFTQNNILARIGILAILLGFRLSHEEVGWIKEIWDFTPFPWLYKFYYLQYLFIVIPGTIIGDIILKWMNKEKSFSANNSQIKNLWLLTFLLLVLVLIVLTGLKARYTAITFIISAIILFFNWKLLKELIDFEILLKMFYWGAYFLILGFMFEPFEGGIKKDHSTLSYYFVTTGLSIFLLMIFTILIDLLDKQKWMNILIHNGQNPMIAYGGISNLIPPILGITYLGSLLNLIVITPWLGFVKGMIITLLLGYIVSLFTKKRIFLRT